MKLCPLANVLSVFTEAPNQFSSNELNTGLRLRLWSTMPTFLELWPSTSYWSLAVRLICGHAIVKEVCN